MAIAGRRQRESAAHVQRHLLTDSQAVMTDVADPRVSATAVVKAETNDPKRRMSHCVSMESMGSMDWVTQYGCSRG